MTMTPFTRRTGFRPSRRGVTLRRWHLKNFKSVRDSGIEIRPLTVVVGANSAGKSTLLQSIRAASQATGSTGYLYPLNGRGVRLGTVAELMYRGPDADEEPIVLSAEFDIREPRSVAGTGGKTDRPSALTPDRHPLVGDRVEQVDPTGRSCANQATQRRPEAGPRRSVQPAPRRVGRSCLDPRDRR